MFRPFGVIPRTWGECLTQLQQIQFLAKWLGETDEAIAEVAEDIDLLDDRVLAIENEISDINGIPSGGTTGQVLKKRSNSNYDADWEDETGGSGIPAGGTTGQVLAKNSSEDGDAGWETIHQLPNGGHTGQVLFKNSDADGDADWDTFYEVPGGGTEGQVLKKRSDDNYDVEWGDDSGGSGIPAGGTTGQVLAKNSDDDGDAGWETIHQLPNGGFAGQVLLKNGYSDGDAGWSDLPDKYPLVKPFAVLDRIEYYGDYPSCTTKYQTYKIERNTPPYGLTVDSVDLTNGLLSIQFTNNSMWETSFSFGFGLKAMVDIYNAVNVELTPISPEISSAGIPVFGYEGFIEFSASFNLAIGSSITLQLAASNITLNGYDGYSYSAVKITDLPLWIESMGLFEQYSDPFDPSNPLILAKTSIRDYDMLIKGATIDNDNNTVTLLFNNTTGVSQYFNNYIYIMGGGTITTSDPNLSLESPRKFNGFIKLFGSIPVGSTTVVLNTTDIVTSVAIFPVYEISDNIVVNGSAPI